MKKVILLIIGVVIVLILIITTFKKASLQESKERFDSYFFHKSYARSGGSPYISLDPEATCLRVLHWVVDLGKVTMATDFHRRDAHNTTLTNITRSVDISEHF